MALWIVQLLPRYSISPRGTPPTPLIQKFPPTSFPTPSVTATRYQVSHPHTNNTGKSTVCWQHNSCVTGSVSWGWLQGHRASRYTLSKGTLETSMKPCGPLNMMDLRYSRHAVSCGQADIPSLQRQTHNSTSRGEGGMWTVEVYPVATTHITCISWRHL